MGWYRGPVPFSLLESYWGNFCFMILSSTAYSAAVSMIPLNHCPCNWIFIIGSRKKSEAARLREYRLGDRGHIVFSYKRLDIETHVRARYEVIAGSEHAIYVS